MPKIHIYWQRQGTLQHVNVAGTVQRGLEQVCLHFAEFTSLLIHFSLSKIWKPTFFIFGWQSPAELIKSEVRRIPSDFIDHSVVFFMQGIFSVCCLEHGRKIIILLYFPLILMCMVSNALLTVPSLSGEVWELCTCSVPDRVSKSRAALGFKHPSELVELDKLLHVSMDMI